MRRTKAKKAPSIRPTLHVALSPEDYARVIAAAAQKFDGVGTPAMFARWALRRAADEVLGADQGAA
jgi:hypothetical protein